MVVCPLTAPEAVAVKLALFWFIGTVTRAGTVTSLLLLASVKAVAIEGNLFNKTTQALEPLAVIALGEQTTEESRAGATAVSVKLDVAPSEVAAVSTAV
jgi:hypothetical protein